MKKKCLIVASVASMIGRFNIPNIELLLSMGYDVTVAANFSFSNIFNGSQADELWNTLESKNIAVYNICFDRNPFNFKNITAYKQIKKLLNENSFSLIHCHSPIGGLLTRLCGKSHRKNGTKILYTAHGFHFYKGAPILNWILYYPMERWLSRYTDAIITINNEDYLLSKNKMKAKNIYYIPGVGVDIDKYSETTVDRKVKRKELGIPLEAIVLLSVGELNKNKNHEVIIRAVAKLNIPNIHYCIAGSGGLESYLKELAKELNLQDNFHLIGYRNDVGEVYKASDIFCFPSKREGLPVSLMEAMSLGLPCIVSKIRGNVDLIENGKGGFLCNTNEIDEYCDAIEKVIENYSMGEFNKTSVQKFGIGVVMEQTKKIYSETIK